MPDTNYITEDIIVKPEIANAMLYAAGTYVKGQLLGRVTATGAFTAYNSGGSDGSEIIAAVCPKDQTINADVPRGPVARGEFNRAGVVAVNGALAVPVVVNDVLIGQAWDAGIRLN